MEWWRDARFGMFIHWGLYSNLGGVWKGKRHGAGNSEWIMWSASIPVAEYKAQAANFNPVEFSAKEIVSLAKEAGMKYIIITAKHHDGFAMYDSKVDDFNIVAATPFKRDPLRELAEECRRQGMKLSFYYSQAQDWTAPGAVAWPNASRTAPAYHWDTAQDGDFDVYLHKKAIPQIKELLENYKEFPVVVWFDTSTVNMTPPRAAEIVALLNQHPNLIWNNRLGGGYRGDTETPEQSIPAHGYPDKDWESCMTINDHWGYTSFDYNFKTTETLLRNLIDIASKGGNYLLNIGPDGTGGVPSPESDRLKQMGAWLKVNGEAIYGTTATLFGLEAGSYSATEKDKAGKPLFVPSWEWRSTTGREKVYLEIFDWHKGVFHVDNMPRKVTEAYLLADPGRSPIKFSQKGTNLDLELPSEPVDSIATVVVLKTAN